MTLINQQRDPAHRPRLGHALMQQRAYWFNLHCGTCGHTHTMEDVKTPHRIEEILLDMQAIYDEWVRNGEHV